MSGLSSNGMASGLCLLLGALLIIGPAAAASVVVSTSVAPAPSEYWGSVVVDGNPAPAGTVITAVINGMERGRIVTTAPGTYGWPGAPANLTVAGTQGDINGTIFYYIDGAQAAQTVVFGMPVCMRLDLTVTTPPPPPTVDPGDDDPVGPASTQNPTAAPTAAPTVSIPSAPDLPSLPGQIGVVIPPIAMVTQAIEAISGLSLDWWWWLILLIIAAAMMGGYYRYRKKERSGRPPSR